MKSAASISHILFYQSHCYFLLSVKSLSQAVDDQNVPGFQHVDRLAEYLLELREQSSLCLSNQQANRVIELWERLDEGDKQRVVYAARHQERLLSGRFRTQKKPSSTPGLGGATRCFLGASSAPAQWPDCCRFWRPFLSASAPFTQAQGGRVGMQYTDSPSFLQITEKYGSWWSAMPS